MGSSALSAHRYSCTCHGDRLGQRVYVSKKRGVDEGRVKLAHRLGEPSGLYHSSPVVEHSSWSSDPS